VSDDPAPGDEAGRGLVFNIQRFCTHDGPGIRTTVFLKCCPLRCAWCHNPEGISPRLQLALDPSKCIGCGRCIEVCPTGAQAAGPGGKRVFDREKCEVCGRCAEVCYSGAIEVVGKQMSAAEVVAVVERDEPFYRTSGGGVTLSGGEPLAQPEFSRSILRLCRRAGTHTAIETCLHAKWGLIRSLLELVDYWMCDLKHYDSAEHKEWTGAGNELIVENLRKLCRTDATVLVRLPLVPGVNDDEQCLEELGRLVAEAAPSEGIEVLPYHRLGEAKYRRLDMPYRMGELLSATEEQTKRAVEILSRAGIEVRSS